MYDSGERPGKGRYRCIECNFIITLENDRDPLPSCSRCGAKRWLKLYR